MNIRIDSFPIERPANDPHRPTSCPLCAADRLREAEGWPALDHDVEMIAPPRGKLFCEGWWLPFALAGVALAVIAFGVWGQWQMITGAG